MKLITPAGTQFIKYVFVGSLNFFVGLATFFLFLRIMELNYLVSFSLSWIIGLLFTYVINFVWVFKPEEKLNFRSRLLTYFLVYLTSYGINLLLLKLLTDYTGGDPFYLQFLIIPVVMLINFSGIKYWSLKQRL